MIDLTRIPTVALKGLLVVILLGFAYAIGSFGGWNGTELRQIESATRCVICALAGLAIGIILARD